MRDINPSNAHDLLDDDEESLSLDGHLDSSAPDIAKTRDERPIVDVRQHEDRLSISITEPRSEMLELFQELGQRDQIRIAESIWKIGAQAYLHVRAEAREARLKSVVDTMKTTLTKEFSHQHETQQLRIQETLKRYFDRDTGLLDQRLNDVLGDNGELRRALTEQLAPEGSTLSKTLSSLVGPDSDLMRAFGGEDGGQAVRAIEEHVQAALQESREAFAKELDPSVDQSAMHRFLTRLREDQKSAGNDIDLKLKKLAESLDANDENSLLSRLMREVENQKRSLLQAVNPDAPGSAMASVQTTLKKLIEEQGKHQRELLEEQDRERKAFELRITEAVTRLDTKHQSAKTSTLGGNQFEEDLLTKIDEIIGVGPHVLTPTGANPGSIPRCKKGDAVVRFTEESAFAGSAVVFEAKHDSSYTIQKALDELDEARKNRDAQVGVFVMATTHAPASFPSFARYGANVLVTWDTEDPTSDARLRAAIYLGMGLVTRQRRQGSEGDIKALTDLESRIQSESERLGKIRKSSDAIRNHADTIADEVRKGQSKLELLVRKSKEVLQALNIEVSEEQEEAKTPIDFNEET